MEAPLVIAHGDPDLVFSPDPQSAEIEDLREQFFESFKLGSESLGSESVDQFYYRLFSKANFRAFHSGLSQATELAREKRTVVRGANDVVFFMTGAGLQVGVSWDQRSSQLHISMEQQIRPTTHAVCSRFGYFALVMFAENRGHFAETPCFTASGVHHIVFQFQLNDELKIREYDSVQAICDAKGGGIPFEYSDVPTVRKTHAPLHAQTQSTSPPD